jgi:hypothetical protein
LAGCKTTKPHAEDEVVKGLIRVFAPPTEMARWVCAAIHELKESILNDFQAGRAFAWVSRQRQVEELYIRALYAIFIADEFELHHIISGDRPNSITPMYEAVNRIIYEGRGGLTVSKPGLNSGEFTPMEILHHGAHTSFYSLLTSVSIAQTGQMPIFADKYYKHLDVYCTRMDYISKMFQAGREKSVVLEAVKQLHRP